MAKDATVINSSGKTFVIRPIVTGSHPPSFFLRVPRDRKLKELAARRPIKIDARAMAGTENPIHFLFEDIDVAASIVESKRFKAELTVLPRHPVMTAGRRVVD